MEVIPTDELIFFRGVGSTCSTSNQAFGFHEALMVFGTWHQPLGPWLQVLLEQQSLQPDVLSHHSVAVAMEVDEGSPVISGEHQNR